MDDPIAIALLPGSSPLAFRLATTTSGEAQVAQFIVSEAPSRRPVWWIVSQPWADAVSFQPMWIDFTPDAGSEPEGPPEFDDSLDPIEDLPP